MNKEHDWKWFMGWSAWWFHERKLTHTWTRWNGSYSERVEGTNILFPREESLVLIKLEIVFARPAPAFDNLFMGCVFNINTVQKSVEKLTFQAFYWSSHSCK